MRTAPRLIIVCLACALLSLLPMPGIAAQQGDNQPRLIKVVALTRHGVRSPTQSSATLSQWSTRNWPQWPVPRGFLTSRGARLVTAMWEDMRGRMLNLGLLPDAACPPPGKVFVRADVDQRTRATAKALLEGLCPGSGQAYAVSNQSPDPLFHPVQAGFLRFDPASVAASIIETSGGDLDRLHEDNAAALTHIQNLSAPMTPELCTRYNLPSNCGLTDLPDSVSVDADGKGAGLSGALATASSMAEIFLLEYGQWPGASAGWGQVDAHILREVLPVHTSVFNTVNRAPVVARFKGASLLSEMAAALDGTHRDQRCNMASLVVFVGHDTNIANVGELLGVHWQLPGYPDDAIPPGSALLLELWDMGGVREVRIRFFAQEPEALHAPFVDQALPGGSAPVPRLTDPARTHKATAALVSAPPVVGEARFSLENFSQRVGKALSNAALVPQEVPPLRLRVDNDVDNPEGPAAAADASLPMKKKLTYPAVSFGFCSAASPMRRFLFLAPPSARPEP